MSTPYNIILIIGRCGSAPEIVTLPGKGTKKARFSVCERKLKREDPDRWHQIVAWGKGADICEKVIDKGRNVSITGTLTYNQWTDNNGVKHTRPEIVMEGLPGLLDSLKKAEETGRDADPETGPGPDPESPYPSDEDLPFDVN